MIDQDLLVRSVTEATSEVFSMMLDMQVHLSGPVGDTLPSASGLISLVGITGEWGGSGMFCCSPLLASIISSRMLGTEMDPLRPVVDEEVLDAVAEMTNMMIGNVKNALEPITGPLAISVPTVIHGRNFEFRNAGGLRGTALSFVTGKDLTGKDLTRKQRFEVRVAFAPTAERNAMRSRIPVLGLTSI